MPRKAKVMALSLTDETRATLSVLARSRTAPAHHVERSAIILHLADRRSASETAAALGIDRQRVTRCARRIAAVGPLEAIKDLRRSGRPPDITEAARAWLIGEACAKPKERGYPHELWKLRLLAAHARRQGPMAGHTCLAELAPSTVHDILNNHRDPAFDERKAKVIEVYAAAEMLRAVSPKRNVPSLSSPTMLARLGRQIGRGGGDRLNAGLLDEYKRLGTVTLSAAVDLVTGVAHHAITRRHRSREFVAFLQQLDAAYGLAC
jgi:hypothetical protein